MSDGTKAAYEKPSIVYWPAEELNSIEAKMSGGGGGVVAMHKYILEEE